MSHRPSTLQQRFDAKWTPEPNTGCWLWFGAMVPDGYGSFSMGGRSIKAHRASWILHNGGIPGDLHVLHKCDVRWCVNPDHLFLGTHADNMTDLKKKGRAKGHSANAGASNPNAISLHVVARIRSLECGPGTNLSFSAAARMIGVTHHVVAAIKNGIHWSSAV